MANNERKAFTVSILGRQPPSKTERSELTVGNLDQRSLIDIILLN